MATLLGPHRPAGLWWLLPQEPADWSTRASALEPGFLAPHCCAALGKWLHLAGLKGQKEFLSPRLTGYTGWGHKVLRTGPGA